LPPDRSGGAMEITLARLLRSAVSLSRSMHVRVHHLPTEVSAYVAAKALDNADTRIRDTAMEMFFYSCWEMIFHRDVRVDHGPA
jgi:hypothetical protein